MSGNFSRVLRAVPRTSLHVVPDAIPPSKAQSDAELIAALRLEIEEQREAMKSRAMIEQAKGVVMVCFGLSPEQASTVLARWSSIWSIESNAVAATLIQVAERGPLLDAGTVLAHEVTREAHSPRP
jgi:hypothetical protein